MELQHLKVKNTEHDYWFNQTLLHHFQHNTGFSIQWSRVEKHCILGISGLHFTKCEGILSFCEALSQRHNKYMKLSTSFVTPKFHLVTTIFKQSNVLPKYLISWHDLISTTTSPSQLLCSIPDVIYVLCFEFFIFLSHSVLYNWNKPENYKTVSECLLCTLNILLWYSTKVLPKMFVEFFKATEIIREERTS